MKKGTTAKKFLATLILCCGILGASPANAFVWPCIDITQISAFISSITTNLSTVTNALTQTKNMEATIASVGSQISSMKDFMSDLRKTIESIKEAVETVTTSVEDTINGVANTMESAQELAEEASATLEELSETTVDDVNGVINSGKEKIAQEVLAESKEQAETTQNEVLKTYDEAINNINQTLDNANTSIDMLVNAVNTNENLKDEQKEELNNKASSIKENISSLKNDANEVLKDIQDRFKEEYAKKVANAYEQYSQAISDYFNGKISKNELAQKGVEFKDSVSSIDVPQNNELINQFVKKADEIVKDIEDLEEDIINTFSNDKEYSDEDGDEEKEASLSIKTSKKYAFTYSTTSPITLAKSVYMNDIDGKPFLISKEFLCKNKGISDIEELKEKSEWFRTCVSRAKTELTYYPDAADDSLYTKYQRNGVYNHISHDYSVANLVTISKMKMFSESWLGVIPEKEEDSERYKLKKRASQGDVDNQASGVATLSLIELWSPRIWSNIKVTDAIGRARSTVKQFEFDDTLHIDNVNGRNQEVAAALDAKPGVLKVGDVDKKVFPNVMLHICGLKAEDISLDSSEADEVKQLEKEAKIKSCIEKFAKGASKGTEDGEAGDVEEGKKKWRERQKMVTNDAAFESLTIGVINNFEATKDYRPSAELKDGELNIVKLQEVVKGGATTREHYGAGAQINYYATQQLLNIIDADATDLQAEILKDMQTIDFIFFPEE